MLDEDASIADWLIYDPERTDRVSWVLGFQDGRAAQVTELQWQVPAGSSLNAHLKRLEVATSMEGPLGPWTPLGSWDVEADTSGSVAPFTLEAPTWARYIRMSGAIPNRRSSVAVELTGRAQSAGARAIRGLSIGGRRVGQRLIGRSVGVAAARGRRQ